MMMIKNRICAILATAFICASVVPSQTFSADSNVHKVTIIDFNGKVIDTLTVNDGDVLDLSGVDVSKLNSYIDIYTEIGFSSWSRYPEKITEDISVHALFQKKTISLENKPVKTEYFKNNGKVDLGGLKVTITSYTQTPDVDSYGNFVIEKEVVDIADKCTAVPDDLKTAFAKGNKAQVNVYPVESSKAILTYDITYIPNLGDADLNGSIDASDASVVLGFYASLSTGKKPAYADGQKQCSDVDRNGLIDANDASLILTYYAQASTGKTPDWDELLSV